MLSARDSTDDAVMRSRCVSAEALTKGSGTPVPGTMSIAGWV